MQINHEMKPTNSDIHNRLFLRSSQTTTYLLCQQRILDKEMAAKSDSIQKCQNKRLHLKY